MKYSFLINQAGVVRCGLLGRVDLNALCVLDYIFGWYFCAKARRIVVDGREFVWLRAEHAADELPLLLNPQAKVVTRRNQFSRLLANLREAGLVESVKSGRDLYVRPSDLAASLASSREVAASKSAHTITKSHDDTVTSRHDDVITRMRDDSSPNHINQQTISEPIISKRLPPHNPPVGETVNGDPTALTPPEEKVYDAYPRRVGKPAGLRAIRHAIERNRFEVVLERTRLFAQTYNGPPEFIPYPSTFFNQDRFLDDPATWRRTGPVNGKSKPSPPRHFNPADNKQPLTNW